MRRLRFLALSAQLLVLPSPVSAQATVRLTVDEVVARALEHGLEIGEARAQVDGARASHRAARALYGPRVVVDAKAFYFNRRPTYDLDLGGSTEGLPLWLDQAVGQLLPDGPMTAGEQHMVDFRVSVVQPLTKLQAIRELDEIRRLDVEIAEVQTRKTAAELAYDVREAAYTLLKLRDAIAILEETETEVLAREKQAKAFVDAELVGPQQALEVGVRLAEVRQQLIKVRALEPVMVSRLRALARLESGATLELVVPDPLPEAPLLTDCVAKARRARGELAEVRLRADQAEAGVRAKIQEMLPDISLVASYQYKAGTADGVPELAVGAVLSWTPFAWGESWYEVRAAKATVRRAELARERVEELIELDVERAFAELEAARESITVAEAALAQGQELYRIEQARFNVRDNTATDLLAAQTSLLRARSASRAARADYLIALAAVRRATGEP